MFEDIGVQGALGLNDKKNKKIQVNRYISLTKNFEYIYSLGRRTAIFAKPQNKAQRFYGIYWPKEESQITKKIHQSFEESIKK